MPYFLLLKFFSSYLGILYIIHLSLQALRILVNNELNELDYAMRLAHYYLRPKGVLVAISFHSLEDTIVKRHLQGV